MDSDNHIHDKDLYNNAILKAHYGKRTFQEVTIIINYAESEGIKQAMDLKSQGIPFVIRGHQGWANFAEKWVKKVDTNSCNNHNDSNSNSNTKGGKRKRILLVEVGHREEEEVEPVYEINTKQMIKDIGNEVVPIVKPDYDPEDPIKDHITVQQFLEESWIPKLSTYYLHQWQFPLSNQETVQKLCLKNNPLPTLGLDLLQYGHDSCVVDGEIDSPFQYIFMGQKDTYSKMHRDTGGMSIIIAPILGKKELTLVHRDDGRLLYHCTAPVAHPDYKNFPLSAFARAWRTTISRGDILVLPPGTYHAAKNLEPCLSYSRFHMDFGDLMPFFNSLIANDAPTIHHKEVIWNSCIEVMKSLDYQALSQTNRTITPKMNNQEMLEIRDGISTLTMLRHIIQTLVNINNANKGHLNNSMILQDNEDENYEWKDLLEDVDVSIRQYLISELSQKPSARTTLSKKDTTSSITTMNATTFAELGNWGDYTYMKRPYIYGSNNSFDSNSSSSFIYTDKDEELVSHEEGSSSYASTLLPLESHSSLSNFDMNISLEDDSASHTKCSSPVDNPSTTINRNKILPTSQATLSLKRNKLIPDDRIITLNSNDNNNNNNHGSIEESSKLVMKLNMKPSVPSCVKGNELSLHPTVVSTPKVIKKLIKNESERLLEVSTVYRDRKGNILTLGCSVSVGLFKEPGHVVELWESKNAVIIHYEGFETIYDEFVCIDDIRDINRLNIDIRKVCENMKVLAYWGEFRDEYLARILPLHPWKRGRKSTICKALVASQQDNDIDDDCNSIVSGTNYAHSVSVPASQIHFFKGMKSDVIERIMNVLYQGPMAKIRFTDDKTNTSYERMFPTAQLIKKRVLRPK